MADMNPMTPGLKTLEEARDEAEEVARRRRETEKASHLTGIACPGCGKEMRWTNTFFLTAPPKRQMYCYSCQKSETL